MFAYANAGFQKVNRTKFQAMLDQSTALAPSLCQQVFIWELGCHITLRLYWYISVSIYSSLLWIQVY